MGVEVPARLTGEHFRISWRPGPFRPELRGGDFFIIGGMTSERPTEPEFLFRKLLGQLDRWQTFEQAIRGIYYLLREAGWEMDKDAWSEFFALVEAEKAVRKLVIDDFIMGGMENFYEKMRAAQKRVMEGSRAKIADETNLDDYIVGGMESVTPVRDIDDIVRPRKTRSRAPGVKREKVAKKPNRRKVVWDD